MTFDTKPVSPQAARSRVAAALLPRFIGHRERDAASIRLALEQGDFETIARLGHNMRGNGVSYGFPEISSIGDRLEEAAYEKDEQGIRDELTVFEAWITERRRSDGP